MYNVLYVKLSWLLLFCTHGLVVLPEVTDFHNALRMMILVLDFVNFFNTACFI